jgi:hypothetical protein
MRSTVGRRRSYATWEKLRVIRTGSKRIVLKAIHYECRTGRFIKFERDGRVWVRLGAGE